MNSSLLNQQSSQFWQQLQLYATLSLGCIISSSWIGCGSILTAFLCLLLFTKGFLKYEEAHSEYLLWKVLCCINVICNRLNSDFTYLQSLICFHSYWFLFFLAEVFVCLFWPDQSFALDISIWNKGSNRNNNNNIKVHLKAFKDVKQQ